MLLFLKICINILLYCVYAFFAMLISWVIYGYYVSEYLKKPVPLDWSFIYTKIWIFICIIVFIFTILLRKFFYIKLFKNKKWN